MEPMSNNSNKKLVDRLKLLAKALCVTPTNKLDIEKSTEFNNWWLVGCKEGDTALPYTKGAKTMLEALENAEGWLAPRIDQIEEDLKTHSYDCEWWKDYHACNCGGFDRSM